MPLTVYEGERYLITNTRGVGHVVRGPDRIFVGVNEEAQRLFRRSAGPDQYLVIRYRELGQIRIEHRHGPCFEFENPLTHESITIKNAEKLNSNEMLVVYKQEQELIQRRLVPGPAIFVPESNEWFHQFKWHGQDLENLGKIRPGVHQFTKLQMIPSQIYYDVTEVRTNDDILIEIQLMLFYEISDVDRMLNGSTDPIADLINAVASDVISFVSALSYQDFLQQTGLLSDMKTYAQLDNRADKIGCSISNVVYRGYKAPQKLQAIQLNAITSRTNLKIKNELDNMSNEITSFKLTKEMDRLDLKQQVDQLRSEMKHAIDQTAKNHEITLNQMKHQAAIEEEDSLAAHQLEMKKGDKDLEIRFLKELKVLGVDINAYLKGQQETPVAEEIQIHPTTML
ncbi:hypothetical protein LOD99_13794 [Oopsacas minuta]|uniref:Band 7 domain-containing protein n=1 Tax=Oopsacas minuta TaxID=111878 RepID=A0AAV7KI71_9METZ|nr:hypothetical protein LOD99_13794 [Oopsacas minuta]